MRIDDGGAARASERSANGIGGKIAAFECSANLVRIMAHRNPQLKSVGVQRLELLETAAWNV
jgi:hypothetical protein